MKTQKSTTKILLFIITVIISSCSITHGSCPAYTLNNSDNPVTN